MKQKKNKGISLIVLIITIVVIIILATAIIVNLSKSNIIGNANEAVFRNDVKSLKIELEIYVADKISDTSGKYDRKKLNADESTGKYGEEDIEDKNKDEKTDIYDILSSLEKSRLKGKVYVEKGKLVFNRSGLTEEEKKILQDEGIEINGMPSITEITYESTLNSVTVNVVISDVSEVEKYKYILDGGEVEESSESIKEYIGLPSGTNYIIEVIAVLKDGTQISKKQIITTKSIEGNIEYILSETELTANDVIVELEYEREIPEGYILECRVGEGEWQEYKEKITITENTTIYGRLYNKELEDAKIESSINISNIDKEPPAEPVIVSNFGYPVITEYGIEIDGTIEIKYDKGYGITNLYSLDNGTTWKEYIEKITIPETGTVMAKSVKESGLETLVSKAINMPTDAIGPEAYDGDETTAIKGEFTKIMKIDSSINSGNKKVYIKYGIDSDALVKGSVVVTFYDNNNEVLGTYTNKDTIVIPENTTNMQIKTTNGNRYSIIYDTYLYEIGIANEPSITGNQHYPSLNEYGVEQSYFIAQISYHNTSIQRVYKIDEGEWLEYQDKEIRLELGQTLYAKGIDKSGKETRIISSYTSTLPADAIGLEAYDGDETTAIKGEFTKIMKIDSSINSGNKKVYIKYGIDSGALVKGSVVVTFYDNNNEVLGTYTNKDTIVIPENTTNMQIKTTNGKRYSIIYDTYLYEIGIAN